MGTVLNSEIIKVNIGLFLVSTLIFTLIAKLRKVFTKNKKSAIVYALFILATFALTAFLSSSKVLNDVPLNSYYGIEILLFALGLLHLYVIRKFFPDLSSEASKFFPEFLFTLAYVCIGLIAFLQVVSRFRPAFSYLFVSAALLFVLPLLFYKMYEFATQITLPVYESWPYPLGKEIKDPSPNELANPRVISFEFKKKENVDDITNFRVKAPKGMEFAKLFYFFINDYNERHPESEIEILDDKTKKPSSWVFHFKPNWYSSIKHINFNQTISENNIHEDSVIICSRVTDT